MAAHRYSKKKAAPERRSRLSSAPSPASRSPLQVGDFSFHAARTSRSSNPSGSRKDPDSARTTNSAPSIPAFARKQSDPASHAASSGSNAAEVNPPQRPLSKKEAAKALRQQKKEARRQAKAQRRQQKQQERQFQKESRQRRKTEQKQNRQIQRMQDRQTRQALDQQRRIDEVLSSSNPPAKNRPSARMGAGNVRVLTILLILFLAACLCILNILYTMVSGRHLWSQHIVLDPAVASSVVDAPIHGLRGTIYDRNAAVLAQEIPAYTLMVRFDQRTEEEKEQEAARNEEDRQKLLDNARLTGMYEQILAKLEKQDAEYVPLYVEDIAETARAIADGLQGSVSADSLQTIMEEAQSAGAVQCELGPGTKELDRFVKERLEAKKIPGLSFLETSSRVYPGSPMASSLIGLAHSSGQTHQLEGILGLEQTMNAILKEEDGEKTWRQSIYGQVITGTEQILSSARNGQDVYLTLDAGLQKTVQEELQKTMEDNKAQSAWCLVMEVETGKILAWAVCPTFDQNNPQDLNYYDLLSQVPLEMGSVMKPFVYAAAVDAGVFPYDTEYEAGSFVYTVQEDGAIERLPAGSLSPYPAIQDALGMNFGTLTFEQGLAVSSNIAVCELLSNHLSQDTFLRYLRRFHFNQVPETPYVSAAAGTLQTDTVPDYLSTGFGQASSLTPLQLVQAYSALFNDGVMMTPYVVESIRDADTGEILQQMEPTIAGRPISETTARTVRTMMEAVLEEGNSGERFAIPGLSMSAKTGTAEIYNPETGTYDTDLFTSSIVAAAPAEDPKILVYWGMQSENYLNYSPAPFQAIMKAALIANTVPAENNDDAIKTWTMPALANHSTSYALSHLEDKDLRLVVIGDGSSIVSQYPPAGQTLYANDVVLLLTSACNLPMPDLTGWSVKDVHAFALMTGLDITIEGSGSVASQSVPAGQTIQNGMELTVQLDNTTKDIDKTNGKDAGADSEEEPGTDAGTKDPAVSDDSEAVLENNALYNDWDPEAVWDTQESWDAFAESAWPWYGADDAGWDSNADADWNAGE